MPTLNWIGKDAVVNHHKEVPFRAAFHNAFDTVPVRFRVFARRAFLLVCLFLTTPR
jgi:hypothetical protein